MDLFGILGLAVTVALFVIGLAFQRGWLPRRHQMADWHPLRDGVGASIFGPEDVFDSSPRRPLVVVRHRLPSYRADGFEIVRVLFSREFRWGRRCVWSGEADDGSVQEFVLMARPKDTNLTSRLRYPSGLPPHYEPSTSAELPRSIAPSSVSWRWATERSRVAVLDDHGREWRVADPDGDLVLFWNQCPG